MLALATLDRRSRQACGLAGSAGDCWRVRSGALPAAPDAAAARVIQLMYENAAASAGEPAIAAALSELELAKSRSTLDSLGRIYQFLVRRVAYRSDADSLTAGGLGWLVDSAAELLIAPADLLSMRSPAGDCDEFASAALSLIIASGLPVTARLRTVAADPRIPQTWSHVYVVVRTASGDVSFDASHGDRLGWEAIPGAVTRRGGRVAYAARRKDWSTANMQITRSHVEGLRASLSGISDVLTATIPDATKTGLKILERRYGNPPAGTYRSETGADGSSLTESFGVAAFPNNVTGFSSGALLAGLAAVGIVGAMAFSQSSKGPRR